MVNQFYITLAIYDCKYNAFLEYCATIESLWTVIHQFTTTLFIFLCCTIFFPNVSGSLPLLLYTLHKKKYFSI